jgi:predicted DNA-binding transcriptional regulator AlpA
VSLPELLAEIAKLDPADCPAVLAALAAKMATARDSQPAGDADELLDAEAAAALLGISESWLYHRRKLPFRVKIGGKLKFSRGGIQRWIKNRLA